MRRRGFVCEEVNIPGLALTARTTLSGIALPCDLDTTASFTSSVDHGKRSKLALFIQRRDFDLLRTLLGPGSILEWYKPYPSFIHVEHRPWQQSVRGDKPDKP